MKFIASHLKKNLLKRKLSINTNILKIWFKNFFNRMVGSFGLVKDMMEKFNLVLLL